MIIKGKQSVINLKLIPLFFIPNHIRGDFYRIRFVYDGSSNGSVYFDLQFNKEANRDQAFRLIQDSMLQYESLVIDSDIPE